MSSPEEQERAEVRRLGRRIGFGRLMQLAEQEWRHVLVSNGHGVGGEFVVGVCRATLEVRGMASSLELLEAYDRLTEPPF